MLDIPQLSPSQAEPLRGSAAAPPIQIISAALRAALDAVPHAAFTFAKLWLAAADLEARAKDLGAARRLLGEALGRCRRHAKAKLYRGYASLERRLGEVDRCRRVYGAWVEAAPARAAAWTALADLERAGFVSGLITQNVDGLHHRAGSRNVVELHGSLDSVVCLECGDMITRMEMQKRLEEWNPGWVSAVGPAETAPDGDADVGDDTYSEFVVPGCERCEGTLKPDVVFFGENVPKARVEECWKMVDRADVLLVVGSSLTVYSGRRFVYGALERQLPIAVLNLGPTRADDVAAAKVEARLGEVMPRLVEALTA